MDSAEIKTQVWYKFPEKLPPAEKMVLVLFRPTNKHLKSTPFFNGVAVELATWTPAYGWCHWSTQESFWSFKYGSIIAWCETTGYQGSFDPGKTMRKITFPVDAILNILSKLPILELESY